MRQFHVSMTFEGDVEADTAVAAAKAFKTSLGLAPESNRPDAQMTGLSVRDRANFDQTVLVGRNVEAATEPDDVPAPRL